MSVPFLRYHILEEKRTLQFRFCFAFALLSFLFSLRSRQKPFPRLQTLINHHFWSDFRDFGPELGQRLSLPSRGEREPATKDGYSQLPLPATFEEGLPP